MNKKTRLLSAVILAAASATLSAATDTLNPAVDGWAMAGAAAAHSNESDNPLRVGTAGNATRTYLRFSIPSYPGKTITAAQLILRMLTPPEQQSGFVGTGSNKVNCPGDPQCVSSRTYNLYRSADTIPDSGAWAGVAVFNNVADTQFLAGTSTGTTPNTDISWGSNGDLVTAVNNARGGDVNLVLHDNTENGNDKSGSTWASNENGTDGLKPRLIITLVDNPSTGDCDGQPDLRISRVGFSSVSIPFGTAYNNPLAFGFTITACNHDLESIKVQGGLAANTTYVGAGTCTGNGPCPLFTFDIGSVAVNAVGGGKNKVNNQGNNVLTWTIPSLSAGQSATIWINSNAAYNNQNKAACGIKNFTGGWSASGFWIDNGVPQQAGPVTPSTGTLVVNLICPVVP